MNKKIKIIATFALSIVVAVASFGIVGCNNSNENSVDYSDKIAKLEQQIKDLQDNQVTDNIDEISKLQQQIKDLQDNQVTDNSDEISKLQQQIFKLEAQGKEDGETISKLEQQIKDLQFNLLNCNFKFFNTQQNKFDYNDFDYSMVDNDYSYEGGSEENELIFSKILSGEYDYREYLGWFSAYPDYIYRFNEESLKCIEAVIREGKFTEELRTKYYGFYVDNATTPYLSTSGMSSVSYQIYFDDDWNIRSIRQSNVIEDNEIKQIDKHYKPNYNKEGDLDGYYLSFISSVIEVVMGDGKIADCDVCATYFQTPRTERVWDGEKQEHEEVTYLSECSITVDFNNNYSGGYEMFDRILLFTQATGFWDIQKVWTAFRAEALVPSLDLYPEKNEQKIRIFNPLY